MPASIEIVKAVYARFAQGDIVGFLALCSEDIEWVVNGPSSLEKCQAFHGIAGVKDFLSLLDQSWRFTSFAPREFIVGQSEIVVLGEEEGVDRSTNETFQNRWAHVFTVREGSIVAFREFLCHWRGSQTPPNMTWNSDSAEAN